MTTRDPGAYSFAAGDAVYARRAGNRTLAWYVIDTPRSPVAGMAAADAHREYGAQRPAFMLFAEVKHIDAGRWAPDPSADLVELEVER